jgi:hypothetical protein
MLWTVLGFFFRLHTTKKNFLATKGIKIQKNCWMKKPNVSMDYKEEAKIG